MKEHFSRFGVPDKLYSDNGPQYSSDEFETFSHEWGFQHVTSSLDYPQSDGLIERAVRCAKEMLEKCKGGGTDINLAFLYQRNTPRDEVLGSPAQRMMARRLKCTLPCAEDLLKPKLLDGVVIKHRLSEKQ